MGITVTELICISAPLTAFVGDSVANLSHADSIDLTRFVERALKSAEIVDCKLADGTTTQCYEFVTVGSAEPTDAIGPFCPPTTCFQPGT